MDLLKTTIGIELGSTRIKAVMLDENLNIISQGIFDWENKLVNGIWTYDLSLAIEGLQSCYRNLAKEFEEKYNMKLSKTGAIGISGMMHGYLAFDKFGNQIAEFRTWRNTITSEAQKILSEKFNFNVPQRWSISHIYQAILNKEPGVKDIDFATTLAGYIHYRLTNNKVVGIGEGSGIFPIDTNILDYDRDMIHTFNELVKNDVKWDILDILPKNLVAGENAGYLTAEGAKFLDPSGILEPGIPLCPPEGDMGTGMIATNSVRKNTGNASIGTSSNITIITNKKIGKYDEIDVITSPSGVNAALVHVNNGTGDINAWINLIYDSIKVLGIDINKNEIFTKLFTNALNAKDDLGLLLYNYYSGEPTAKINEGRPLIVRDPSKSFTSSEFIKAHIYSLLSTIRMGMDILIENEGVRVDKISGHGGFFKTPIVGQRMLSSAIGCDVVTLASADLGGPYGMALLASYYLFKEENELLEDFLDNKVFKDLKASSIRALENDIILFNNYYKEFVKGLAIEREAIKSYR